MFRRALATDQRLPGVWAMLASLRKMTAADAAWVTGAEELAASGVSTADEIGLKFAIGKYLCTAKQLTHCRYFMLNIATISRRLREIQRQVPDPVNNPLVVEGQQTRNWVANLTRLIDAIARLRDLSLTSPP